MISNKHELVNDLDGYVVVSIPNGDKHDFKPCLPQMLFPPAGGVSIPNGDKHDFKLGRVRTKKILSQCFNPQWG